MLLYKLAFAKGTEAENSATAQLLLFPSLLEERKTKPKVGLTSIQHKLNLAGIRQLLRQTCLKTLLKIDEHSKSTCKLS